MHDRAATPAEAHRLVADRGIGDVTARILLDEVPIDLFGSAPVR